MIITSTFVEFGRMVDTIPPLKIDEAMKQQAVHENAMDNSFQNLFKARSLHVCWQILICVFLILLVL